MSQEHEHPTENEGLMPNLEHEEMAQDHVDHHGAHHDGHHVHVTPFWPMLMVFVGLLLLTALTLWTAKAEYFYVSNSVNLTVALCIAGLKGLLVAAFFMHLLYDKAMNTVISVATMFAVVLFLTLTLVDLSTQDIVDKTEEGEIAIGGSVQINMVDGAREVSRGAYSPFWTDNPGLSIVEQARQDPENVKKREKYHSGDDHSESSYPIEQTPDTAAIPEAVN
jgi:cytochrome c oxidase subunit 4